MKKTAINSSMFFLLIILNTAYAASFDCAKASRAIEREICADLDLSALDDRLAESYGRALLLTPEVKQSQRDWLRSLHQCESSPPIGSCLKPAYQNRIVALNFIANPNRGLVGVQILGIAKRGEQNLLEIGPISPNSPAQEAAIENGDFFSEINGKPIIDMGGVFEALNEPAGTVITFRVVRKDGTERNVRLKLASRNDSKEAPYPIQPPPEATSEPILASRNASEQAKPEPMQSSPGATSDPIREAPAKIETKLASLYKVKTSESDAPPSRLSGVVLLLIALATGAYFYLKKKKNASSNSEITQAVVRPPSDAIVETKPDPLNEIYIQALSFYEKDELNKAKHLFMEGAKSGHVDSQFYLGKLLIQESQSSDDSNSTVGVAWLKTAAKNGHEKALALIKDLEEKPKASSKKTTGHKNSKAKVDLSTGKAPQLETKEEPKPMQETKTEPSKEDFLKHILV